MEVNKKTRGQTKKEGKKKKGKNGNKEKEEMAGRRRGRNYITVKIRLDMKCNNDKRQQCNKVDKEKKYVYD